MKLFEYGKNGVMRNDEPLLEKNGTEKQLFVCDFPTIQYRLSARSEVGMKL